MDVLVGGRDPALRRHIAYALGGRGRIVTTGKSASLLIDAIDEDFDLIILDTDLEGMDGMETLEILRQIRPRVPILFLHRAEDDVDEMRRGGGRVGAIVRTADDAALVRAVDDAVARPVGEENRVSTKG